MASPFTAGVSNCRMMARFFILPSSSSSSSSSSLLLLLLLLLPSLLSECWFVSLCSAFYGTVGRVLANEEC